LMPTANASKMVCVALQ